MASIDGLRAIAALAVLTIHLFDRATARWDHSEFEFLRAATRWGAGGVQVFFVISGFAIARSLHRLVITPRVVGRFVVRRSIRLDPLFWVLLTVTLGYYSFRNGDAYIDKWFVTPALLNALYLNGVAGVGCVMVPSWTLCIEVQLYLTLALLSWAAQRIRSEVAVFVPVVAAAVVAGIATTLAGEEKCPWFLAHWGPFFLGVLIAWSCERARLLKVAAILAAAEVAIYLINTSSEVGRGHLVSAVTALCVALCVHTCWLDKLLTWGPLQFVGRISYSLYLVHVLVGTGVIGLLLRQIDGAPTGAEAALFFTAGVVASVAAATVTHALIEKPTQRLARKVSLAPRA